MLLAYERVPLLPVLPLTLHAAVVRLLTSGTCLQLHGACRSVDTRSGGFVAALFVAREEDVNKITSISILAIAVWIRYGFVIPCLTQFANLL